MKKSEIINETVPHSDLSEGLKTKNNEWEWKSTRLTIVDPEGKEHILTSEQIGDFCLNAIFDEIAEYVKTKNGVLK